MAHLAYSAIDLDGRLRQSFMIPIIRHAPLPQSTRLHACQYLGQTSSHMTDIYVIFACDAGVLVHPSALARGSGARAVIVCCFLPRPGARRPRAHVISAAARTMMASATRGRHRGPGQSGQRAETGRREERDDDGPCIIHGLCKKYEFGVPSRMVVFILFDGCTARSAHFC